MAGKLSLGLAAIAGCLTGACRACGGGSMVFMSDVVLSALAIGGARRDGGGSAGDPDDGVLSEADCGGVGVPGL